MRILQFGNSLFGAIKLTKNADFDKYKYSGYGIGFDAWGSFLLSDGSKCGKNYNIWCWWVHLDILVIGKKKKINSW